MKKTYLAITFILASLAGPLCADGFSESDRDLIAGDHICTSSTEIETGLATPSNNDILPPAQAEINIQETSCTDNLNTESDIQSESNWNTSLGGMDIPLEELAN